MSYVVALVIVATTVWVGIDAHNLGVRRGCLGGGMLDISVASWVVCCVFIWIIAFPCYLATRAKYTALRNGGGPHATPGYGVNGGFGGYALDGSQGFPVGYADYGPGLPGPLPNLASSQLASFPAPATNAPPVAPPQVSPDGRWWWDGRQWIPTQAAPPSAPSPF